MIIGALLGLIFITYRKLSQLQKASQAYATIEWREFATTTVLQLILWTGIGAVIGSMFT